MSRQQEVATCKRRGSEFFYKELFCSKTQIYTSVVKVQYVLTLDKDIIKQNCDFNFYYNRNRGYTDST